MPKPVDTSDAIKKALEMSRTEKERMAVRAAEAGMASGAKKDLKVNVRRSADSKALR
jgi:hypothetical protein